VICSAYAEGFADTQEHIVGLGELMVHGERRDGRGRIDRQWFPRRGLRDRHRLVKEKDQQDEY
jgi:hypothetical protein